MGRLTNQQIEQIQALRQIGKSVPEISNIVGASMTSVLRYIKNVEILPEFLNEWTGKRGGSKKRKLLKEKFILEEVRNILSSGITDRERMIFIAALYWAEGNKKDFILTNTDPLLIKTFMDGLRSIFNVEDNRIQISIRIYEDLDRDKCLQFWSGITKIPIEKFVNVYTLIGKKTGKLEYGICRVRVTRGGDLLKKVTSINSIVSSV